MKPAGKTPAHQLSKTTILNSVSPWQNVTMDKLQLKTYALGSSDTVLSQCNTFVSKDTWHLTRGEAASSASVPITRPKKRNKNKINRKKNPTTRSSPSVFPSPNPAQQQSRHFLCCQFAIWLHEKEIWGANSCLVSFFFNSCSEFSSVLFPFKLLSDVDVLPRLESDSKGKWLQVLLTSSINSYILIKVVSLGPCCRSLFTAPSLLCL